METSTTPVTITMLVTTTMNVLAKKERRHLFILWFPDFTDYTLFNDDRLKQIDPIPTENLTQQLPGPSNQINATQPSWPPTDGNATQPPPSSNQPNATQTTGPSNNAQSQLSTSNESGYTDDSEPSLPAFLLKYSQRFTVLLDNSTKFQH